MSGDPNYTIRVGGHEQAYASDGSVLMTLEGNASAVTLLDTANLYAAADVETAFLELKKTAPTRLARGAVTSNIASLAAFTVTGNAYDDGLTYIAGDRVLLTAQTTPAECGVYVVGTVASTTAPLTRATDMPAGLALPNGSIVEISEGTVGKLSTWKSTATTAGGAVIGTNDPAFYPRVFKKVVTLSSGTYLIGAGGGSEALFLLSTTTSTVQATRNTAGGTLTLTTHYYAPVTTRIAGKAGVAAASVTASVAAGTVNTADTSTIDVTIINW